MIIISVIVSSDFRGNQGIGNVIEIMQRRRSVTMIIIIIIMHMISLLSDFGVGLQSSAAGHVVSPHGRASLRPPAMLYQLMDFEEGEGGGSPDVSVSLVSLSMGMGWAGTSICFPRKPRISFMLTPQQFLLKSQLLSTNDVVPYMHDRID